MHPFNNYMNMISWGHTDESFALLDKDLNIVTNEEYHIKRVRDDDDDIFSSSNSWRWRQKRRSFSFTRYWYFCFCNRCPALAGGAAAGGAAAGTAGATAGASSAGGIGESV